MAATSEMGGGSIHGDRSDVPSSTDGETALTPDQDDSNPSPPTEQAILDTPTLGPIHIESKSPLLSPRISRNPSFSGSSSYQEDWEAFPPLERLSMLDLLDNFALPQQFEKLSKGFSAQTQKVRKSREAFKTRSHTARERMVEQWRRRVPSAEEQLERYKKRMRTSVDKLGKQWSDTKGITLREKVSFICGVLNIFISGYLIGAFPEHFHWWYTIQVLYFMPIRYFTYHQRGYHYFLADLCYFVNFLLVASIWCFPNSKRLFTATYCLAFGNNAVAIIMWRNSLVFHSFDKVTSLFIHIMPCATLHCLVHLIPEQLQKEKFPAVWTVKHSPPGSPTAYANVLSMLALSTIPYAVWQLTYYVFITVRRRDKIAAGRPTSFTWLRRSYSKTWIGNLVLGLPSALQEPAFMMIQYLYAVLTMIPCPLWFYSRWASACFLMLVFTWSVQNGATYYIDVFGKRFQKELEQLKSEVAKWQTSPDGGMSGTDSPLITPHVEKVGGEGQLGHGVGGDVVASGSASGNGNEEAKKKRRSAENADVDGIPLLNEEVKNENARVGRAEAQESSIAATTDVDLDSSARDVARSRNVGSFGVVGAS